MINIEDENIIVGDAPIQTGDVIGMFYEEDGDLIWPGFVVWNEDMPPAAITVLGAGNNGYGFEEGAALDMFVLDSATGSNYSVANVWNTAAVPFAFNDGNDGYSANGLYQTLSMTLTESSTFCNLDIPFSKFSILFCILFMLSVFFWI